MTKLIFKKKPWKMQTNRKTVAQKEFFFSFNLCSGSSFVVQHGLYPEFREILEILTNSIILAVRLYLNKINWSQIQNHECML